MPSNRNQVNSMVLITVSQSQKSSSSLLKAFPNFSLAVGFLSVWIFSYCLLHLKMLHIGITPIASRPGMYVMVVEQRSNTWCASCCRVASGLRREESLKMATQTQTHSEQSWHSTFVPETPSQLAGHIYKSMSEMTRRRSDDLRLSVTAAQRDSDKHLKEETGRVCCCVDIDFI